MINVQNGLASIAEFLHRYWLHNCKILATHRLASTPLIAVWPARYNLLCNGWIHFPLTYYASLACHTISCHVMSGWAMPCIVQSNAIQCNAVQCNAIKFNEMQCNAMQCNWNHCDNASPHCNQSCTITHKFNFNMCLSFSQTGHDIWAVRALDPVQGRDRNAFS